MKLAEAAREIMLKTGQTLIWYGDPQTCHDAHDLAGKMGGRHPLNVRAAVIQSCAKSGLFHRSGEIEHLGRYYPVYALNKDMQTRDPVNGQYAYENDWLRMCVCGHQLDGHIAGGFECGTIPGDYPEAKWCGCRKFRQKYSKGKKVYVTLPTPPAKGE